MNSDGMCPELILINIIGQKNVYKIGQIVEKLLGVSCLKLFSSALDNYLIALIPFL